MLFEMKFEVVEIFPSGGICVCYLRGKKKDVKKDIAMYKNKAKRYEMVGKNGMVVWV